MNSFPGVQFQTFDQHAGLTEVKAAELSSAVPHIRSYFREEWKPPKSPAIRKHCAARTVQQCGKLPALERLAQEECRAGGEGALHGVAISHSRNDYDGSSLVPSRIANHFHDGEAIDPRHIQIEEYSV